MMYGSQKRIFPIKSGCLSIILLRFINLTIGNGVNMNIRQCKKLHLS